MSCATIQQCLSEVTWIDYSTLTATIAAIVAAASAYFSYTLSKRIYNEIKSDEVIIAGHLHHPGLQDQAHNDCVLRCTLLNKSQRKAYINEVKVFDQSGNQIPITWSSAIDHLGNILNPTGLLGLKDSVDLVIRRNDGKEFLNSTVQIKHSFNSNAIELQFDPYQGWV